MQRIVSFLLLVLVLAKVEGDPGDFRPPAVPLIVFSPHISGESFERIGKEKQRLDASYDHTSSLKE